MTTAAEPTTEVSPTVAVASRPDEGPLAYLGIRRGWWVVLCLLLLVAVDVIPAIGPYLALGVLLWMVSGLAHAKPRRAPVAEARRLERSGAGLASEHEALSS